MEEQKRKMSILLGVAIFFFPHIFGWFTLRKGYSGRARVITLVWACIPIWGVILTAGNSEASHQRSASEDQDIVEAAETITEVEAPVKSPRVTPEPLPDTGPELKEIGARFEVGKIAYRITKKYLSRRVGNKYFGEDATSNAIFLVVKYTAENIGNETKTVMANSFTYRDSLDRTFQPSSGATTALAMSEGNDMILTQLQPGIERPAVTVFEVPERSVVIDDSVLIIKEDGFFSTGEALVRMPPFKSESSE